MAIEATKEGVKFSCQGDIGNGAVSLRNHTNVEKPEMNVNIELTEPVALTFSLKYLVNFCKASGLSGSVKLCLSNEVPLLVEYELASNSYLRFYLAPKVCSTHAIALLYHCPHSTPRSVMMSDAIMGGDRWDCVICLLTRVAAKTFEDGNSWNGVVRFTRTIMYMYSMDNTIRSACIPMSSNFVTRVNAKRTGDSMTQIMFASPTSSGVLPLCVPLSSEVFLLNQWIHLQIS